jgi:hypothetical protein
MQRRLGIVCAVVLLLLGGIAFADNPIGLRWDANTEEDLGGYFIYEAEVEDGFVLGERWLSVPTNDYVFEDDHPSGTFFWCVTAVDLVGNESGFSNVVTATIDHDPPAPPVGCEVY